MRGLAFDGRCKTFDASADGFARGEGIGSVWITRGSAEKTGENELAPRTKWRKWQMCDVRCVVCVDVWKQCGL